MTSEEVLIEQINMLMRTLADKDEIISRQHATISRQLVGLQQMGEELKRVNRLLVMTCGPKESEG